MKLCAGVEWVAVRRAREQGLRSAKVRGSVRRRRVPLPSGYRSRPPWHPRRGFCQCLAPGTEVVERWHLGAGAGYPFLPVDCELRTFPNEYTNQPGCQLNCDGTSLPAVCLATTAQLQTGANIVLHNPKGLVAKPLHSQNLVYLTPTL